MRLLPDNPNLEFLKREAKDVLAGIRETTPDASLSDAQRALAEQYGFRSWPDLRAEVGRRLRVVPVPDASLADGLAAAFGLGAPTEPMQALVHEPIGRKWVLQTTSGRYVAWPVYAWMTDAQAASGVALMDAARAAGVATPTPVRSPAGRLVERVGDDNWRVDEWLEAGPPPVHPVRKTVAREVGAVLGRIHRLAVPADGEIGPYLTHVRRPGEWDELVSRARAAGVPWRATLESAVPVYLELGAQFASPADGGTLLTSHRNLIPENVRMVSGDRITVLHWEFSGPIVPSWELASSMLHWTSVMESGGRFNAAAAQAMLDGYADATGTRPSLALEDFCVAAAGWLNFAHSQICEAIDAKDAERQDFALREATGLMERPLSVARLEEIVATLRG